ncbi:MAG: hypothetical protein ACREH8_23135, partial [Opitutaceae bacterium]
MPQTNRHSLVIAASFLSGICCAAASTNSTPASPGRESAVPVLERMGGVKPRNIVFILCDDHRYDALGFMGHPFLEIPHLDSLARNGVH